MIIDCGIILHQDHYFIDAENVITYRIDSDSEKYWLCALDSEKCIPMYTGTKTQCENVLKLICVYKSEKVFWQLSDIDIPLKPMDVNLITESDTSLLLFRTQFFVCLPKMSDERKADE